MIADATPTDRRTSESADGLTDEAANGRAGQPRPLDGLRVLDAATYIAAPVSAAILGEFGAEVIKVERPEGDPLRVFGTPSGRPDATLCWMNDARNKRSITLNLSHPKGAELFRRLAAGADVVCENFRPGTMEKWGLGYAALKAVNPRLIMLRVTTYGQTGPYRDRVGFARMAHAMSGIGYLAGWPGEPPVNPGPASLADYVSGAYGALGVMLALEARHKTGEGQYVDLAMYEALFRTLDEAAPAFAKYGKRREPSGSLTTSVAPNANYATGDGKYVSISCTDDKMFGRLAVAMGRPELARDARFRGNADRLAHRDAVEAMVEAWTRSMSRDDLVAHCGREQVPCAPILSIADIFADPHYQARGNLVTLEDTEAGPITLPGVTPRLSATPGRIDSLGPRLGDANAEVYAALGLSGDDLAGLRAEGVV